MAGLESLAQFAERRAETALKAWQRHFSQCEDAKQKLQLLRQHEAGYRDLMHADLRIGQSAASIMAHIGFIRQIEAVLLRQENEIEVLEEGCGRLWGELLEARREQRMYEILIERARLQTAQTASRRRQAEIDELVQRTAKMR